MKQLSRVLTGALLAVAILASDLGAPRAQDGETAEDVFRDHISGPIVQTRCVNCHVQGGLSGHTRLVFVNRSSEANHEALNLQALETFLAAVNDEGGGGTRILNKIQGVSHGGGVQVPLGSAHFANMERFLGLLGEAVVSVALTPETLFDTVVLASPRKTLRRAALIFAGRIPTEAEYTAVEGGDAWALRNTIRGLMMGSEFHEFLIRGSNDRLRTDRDNGGVIDRQAGYFVAFSNEAYRRRKAAYSSGGDYSAYYQWEDRVQYGFRRSPLELIAYVAENDLPYTEILTADYIMANPWAAAAYGASTQFNDREDVYEFRPSRIVSYYRKGDEYVAEHDPVIQAVHVSDPGPLITAYPHAGILNTTAYLLRYPTTATNRNRARARWTYYHFLGLDVEKSASRTTDPVALADTNNPTMHNPACTVCHSVLDPVAGAFQNYGDEGLYKDQQGGQDSLDRFYKEGAGPSLAVEAESQAARQTLEWSVSLASGVETLRVMYSNHFWDEAAREGGRMFLDRLRVTDDDGEVLASHEFEDLEAPVAHWGHCGERRSGAGRNAYFELWAGHSECAFWIDVEVPSDGFYNVEIVAWSNGWDERYEGDGYAELSVVANPYEEGDIWYRNMRVPGFAGDEPPYLGSSLQWLAKQIVADERFAEAAVRFWWPAIMGSKIAEPPEDAADADFEGRLLAANAQDAEVVRLTDGFRRGFPGSPYTYNLKDLLVEIVSSKWFRVNAVTDADPVRRVALRDAGARRLLTPEELARKTLAVTGFQWGRDIRTDCWPVCDRTPNALTDDYRLLYGGIDSDGITERGRDITSVMAGVAKSHAVQVSCPVIMREIYLLPDADRRLFAGIDPYVTPTSESNAVFEIEAGSRAAKQTLSIRGPFTAGSKTVRFTYTNSYWDEVSQRGRHIRLDRLDVRNAAGRVVASHELEDLAASMEGCGHNRPNDDHFALYCEGSVDVPIDVPTAGTYNIEIIAWADHVGGKLPRLSVMVESDTRGSAGAAAIKNKLVELHDKLLGVRVTPDSPDVEAAYRLFVDVWQRKREAGDAESYFRWLKCDWRRDLFFYEGILDNAVVEHVEGHRRWYEFDRDRIDAFLDGIDFEDPHYTAQTWMVVLAAMMMDYRYLYL